MSDQNHDEDEEWALSQEDVDRWLSPANGAYQEFSEDLGRFILDVSQLQPDNPSDDWEPLHKAMIDSAIPAIACYEHASYCRGEKGIDLFIQVRAQLDAVVAILRLCYLEGILTRETCESIYLPYGNLQEIVDQMMMRADEADKRETELERKNQFPPRLA